MKRNPIHIWKADGKWHCAGPDTEEKASFATAAEAWLDAQRRADEAVLIEAFRQFLEEL